MSTNVRADAKFLHRIFMSLICLTIVMGTIVGISTVQAMTSEPGSCVFFCGQ